MEEQGHKEYVETAGMDGHNLGFDEAMFDISVTLFGLFFFSDPAKGAREIYRTLKPGGTAVVRCWKFVGLSQSSTKCRRLSTLQHQ